MAGADEGPRMQVLSSDDCSLLLATQQVGRLGVIAEHYPLILPVNYALDRGVVVVRMDPGLKLTASQHANVTFEVDDIDPVQRSGWSVLVRGLAEEVGPEHGAELLERTRATGVEPWAPGEHGHWLRIIPHRVTGRRIVPGELPPAFDPRGYL